MISALLKTLFGGRNIIFKTSDDVASRIEISYNVMELGSFAFLDSNPEFFRILPDQLSELKRVVALRILEIVSRRFSYPKFDNIKSYN